MQKLNFFLLGPRKEIVTGGHKYEQDLFEICTRNPDILAQQKIVGAPKAPKWLKPFIEFGKSLKHNGSDIIIFNSSCCLRLLAPMLWLRAFSNKKLYSIHHHFIYLEFKGFKRWIYKTSEYLFLKSSHKIIVPSPYIFEELKNLKKEDKLLLWRIPFETKQLFSPNPIPGNLTFAGTIEPRKGLIYLFKALKLIQDQGIPCHLDILGKVVNENYFNTLRNFAKENNLNVSFKGFVEFEEKNKILSETDVFVFPSLLEGFGMVLVEAQVYGLPIVCFDNSAMPFSVKNDVNGFTVPTGDYEKMAEKIKEIITNRNLRARLSEGALMNLNNQWNYNKFETAVHEYFSNLRNSNNRN